MNKVKRLFVFFLFLVCGQLAWAQVIDYLQKANASFIAGNYSHAVTMYRMYYAETGRDVSALLKVAEQCRNYLREGDDAAIAGNNEDAEKKYKEVLKLNPDDESVKTKLSSIHAQTHHNGLQIGQEYNGGRVAYIDNTGKHGFLIMAISKVPTTHRDGLQQCPKDCRVPTLRELKLIAPSAEILDLGDSYYWSTDLAFKGGLGVYSQYYCVRYENTSDETNFRVIKQEKKEHIYLIYIKDF